jgi:exo-beta-1,3-glucanase (GH17 family)
LLSNTWLLNSWKRYAVLYSAAFILLATWIYQKNQAVDIVSPQLGESGKLQCVSYAPYYGKGQSPFVLGTHISPAQIDADLKRLQGMTDCVRTYSVGQGLDYVPEAAHKLGMKVILGAWIGWTEADNHKEILLATQKANAYPETVKAIIVGNEVLLRGEQTEQKIHSYLQLAKSLTKMPLTYADVWEFWQKHQALAQDVDFVTVHILPYWENDPVAVEVGVKHTADIMAHLQTVFKKPILIGETGWPSVGRARNHSVPSLVNEARYIREFLQKAHEQHWQYNVIEAVDQPWKRVLEGTVGGYWGVFDTQLNPKFLLTGSVRERTDGVLPWLLALVGASAFAALGLVRKPKSSYLLVSLAALGAVFVLTTYLQIEYLMVSCRDVTEWLALGGVAVLGALVVLAELNRHTWQQTKYLALMNWVVLALLLGEVVTGWLIYMDGRYRNYPVILFALPMLVLAIAGPYQLALRHQLGTVMIWLYRLLTVLALSLAILCVWSEPLTETAYYWLAVVILAAYGVVKSSNLEL